jgi:hypothetical protein
MTVNKGSLVSGRVPVTDYANLTADRYQFLGLTQAEPNLGPGANNTVLVITTNNTRSWSNSLTLTGNVSANYFIGNGSLLTGIFTTITNQTFQGDGSTVAFTLNTTATSVSILVTVNGITQTPDVDYLVIGTILTFMTAPAVADVIQVRFLSNNSVSGTYSNANVSGFLPIYSGDLSAANITATGNIQGNYILGNGAFLTGITGGVSTYGNSNVTALLSSGTVITDYLTTGNIKSNAITLNNTDDFAQIVFSNDGGATNNGQIKVDTGTNMVVNAAGSFYVKQAGSDRVAVTNTTSDFMAATNVRIQSNKTGSASTWTFDNAGLLTLPGGGTITSALGSPQQGLWLSYNGHSLLLNSDGQFWTGGIELGGNALPGYVGSYSNITLDTNIGNSPGDSKWVFDTAGNLTLPGGGMVSDTSADGIGLIVANPPTVIVISGADFTVVNTTYSRSVGDIPPKWTPAGYNPVTDPYILFDNSGWGIWVPGFGQSLYVNTGTINAPLAQWNLHPPLGSVAPTGAYTFNNPAWTFDNTGNLILPSNTANINYANGQPYGGSGGTANTGNFIFDTADLDGTAFDEIALTGTNSGNILITATGLAMVAAGYESGGMVSDGTNTYLFNGDPTFVNGIPQPGVGKIWQFDSTGNLNTPQGGYIGPADVKGNGTMLTGGTGNLTSVTSYYADAPGIYSSCVTANPDGTLNITTYGNGTGQLGQWTFSSANLLLASQNVSGDAGESALLAGTRKIVNGQYSGAAYGYSAELAAGGTPSVAYTASNEYVQSVRLTFAVESVGTNPQWEQFDVVATKSLDTPGTVNFVVSNRIKARASIADTVVTATINLANEIEISLNLDAGQTSGWSSFDSVEFGVMFN